MRSVENQTDNRTNSNNQYIFNFRVVKGLRVGSYFWAPCIIMLLTLDRTFLKMACHSQGEIPWIR